jgi:hypothetical protein
MGAAIAGVALLSVLVTAPVDRDSSTFDSTAGFGGAVVAVTGLVALIVFGFCAISVLAAGAFFLSSSSKSSADRHPRDSKRPANPFLFFFFFWGVDLDVDAGAGFDAGTVGAALLAGVEVDVEAAVVDVCGRGEGAVVALFGEPEAFDVVVSALG